MNPHLDSWIRTSSELKDTSFLSDIKALHSPTYTHLYIFTDFKLGLENILLFRTMHSVGTENECDYEWKELFT